MGGDFSPKNEVGGAIEAVKASGGRIKVYLVGMREEIDSFHAYMIRELQLRLDLLYDAVESMRGEGLPVRAIAPQGAIYLSVQFKLAGRSNEEIRKLLLDEAGFAVVPFQAFGSKKDDGWFRLSVGAVSPAEIEAGLRRVRSALRAAI